MSKKKTVAELRAENKLLRSQNIVTAITVVSSRLIFWGALVLIAR